MQLSEKAMLASLTISQWSAKKHDKRVSQEVADKHNSDVDMGRFNKSLVAKKALEKIQKIAGQARTDFYYHTLPWKDDGSRILTNTGYLKLTELVRDYSHQWEDATQEFFEQYDSYVEQAKKSLNGLFDADDYPNASELRQKFRFGFHVNPLPEAEDFRVKLSAEEIKLCKQQIEQSLQDSVKDAMKDVWLRMRGVVASMAEKLKAYKVTPDGTEGVFRDSLVQNMRDLLSIIPALNLTEDSAVKKFAAEMEKLCKYDANTLRDNDGTRLQVAKAAEDILNKMQQYV